MPSIPNLFYPFAGGGSRKKEKGGKKKGEGKGNLYEVTCLS